MSTISSPCLSRTMGTTVEEAMPVSKGSPTLDGDGVRTARPEDS